MNLAKKFRYFFKIEETREGFRKMPSLLRIQGKYHKASSRGLLFSVSV